MSEEIPFVLYLIAGLRIPNVDFLFSYDSSILRDVFGGSEARLVRLDYGVRIYYKFFNFTY